MLVSVTVILTNCDHPKARDGARGKLFPDDTPSLLVVDSELVCSTNLDLEIPIGTYHRYEADTRSSLDQEGTNGMLMGSRDYLEPGQRMLSHPDEKTSARLPEASQAAHVDVKLSKATSNEVT